MELERIMFEKLVDEEKIHYEKYIYSAKLFVTKCIDAKSKSCQRAILHEADGFFTVRGATSLDTECHSSKQLRLN